MYPSTESLLKKYSIKPKKGFGQNFLVAMPTAEKICKLLDLSSGDSVIEIGPGLGILTRIICKQTKNVVVIEKDISMADIINTELGGSVKIVNGDVLDVDFGSIIHRKRDFKVIGNIPYNLTSPIIFKLIENKKYFQFAILMVQKEVAERLVAKPNSKDYGVLSIMTQVNAKISKLFDVSPASFIPRPKVTSSIVRFDFADEPQYKIEDMQAFSKLVRTVFQTRRKTIKNGLLRVVTSDVDEILSKAKISPTLRPENLSIEDFIRLANY